MMTTLDDLTFTFLLLFFSTDTESINFDHRLRCDGFLSFESACHKLVFLFFTFFLGGHRLFKFIVHVYNIVFAGCAYM